MRHQSVQSLSSVDQNSKKENVMRKSFTSALVVVVLLTAATPAMAAPRDRVNREVPAVAKIVQIIKKVFGPVTQADPSIPIPAPATTGNR